MRWWKSLDTTGRLGALALGAAVILIGWGWWYAQEADRQERMDASLERLGELIADRDVMFCWRGSARSVDVRVTNSTGGTDELEARKNNQCIDATIPAGAGPIVFTVQNAAETGDVTCRLNVDGDTRDTQTSSGRWAVARCAA